MQVLLSDNNSVKLLVSNLVERDHVSCWIHIGALFDNGVSICNQESSKFMNFLTDDGLKKAIWTPNLK